MDQLPVDVHYAKMGEWIEDREAVLGKKWPKEVKLLKAAAPTLVQRNKYEIPAVKKAVQRWRAVGPEIDRQREEGVRRAIASVQQRADLLASVGLPASLPTTLDVEAALSKRTAAASQAYDRLSQRVLCDDALQACLDYFTASMHHANTTVTAQKVFPWLSTRGALAGSETEVTAENEDVPPEINWDDDDDDEAPAPQLDWGDDDAVAVIAGEHIVDLSVAKPPAISSSNELFSALPQPGTTAMHTDRARVAVSDEIAALRGFLFERVLSLSDAGSHSSGIDTTSMLKRLHAFTSGPIPAGISSDVAAARLPVETALLRVLDQTVNRLETTAEVSVLRLAASHQATARFLSQCEQLAFVSNRASASTAAGDDRKAEALIHLEQAEAQLASLIATTKGLQAQCEEALRRMFAPREAYIVGDINNL